MTLTDAITNVTLTSTPTLITRQRANIGSSRSRGAEIEYARVLRSGWNASAGYLFADATLSTGARTPQVPRNQATAQLSYRSLAGVQARWSSMQFDDDLNQFPLQRFLVMDLFAAHRRLHPDRRRAVSQPAGLRRERCEGLSRERARADRKRGRRLIRRRKENRGQPPPRRAAE